MSNMLRKINRNISERVHGTRDHRLNSYNRVIKKREEEKKKEQAEKESENADS